jgi:hypothetical protein
MAWSAAYWSGGGTCECSGLHGVPLAADSPPLQKPEHVMADETTVPVLLSMRVKCWCGYASDQDFLLDMPQNKAQSMQASELTACPDCGAPIRIHLKRTSTAVGELRGFELSPPPSH